MVLVDTCTNFHCYVMLVSKILGYSILSGHAFTEKSIFNLDLIFPVSHFITRFEAVCDACNLKFLKWLFRSQQIYKVLCKNKFKTGLRSLLLCKILISLMDPFFFFEGNCRFGSKSHQFICSTNEKFPRWCTHIINDTEWLQSKIDSLETLIENAQLVCTIYSEILYSIKDLQQSLHRLKIDRDQLSPQQSMIEYSGEPGRPRF